MLHRLIDTLYKVRKGHMPHQFSCGVIIILSFLLTVAALIADLVSPQEYTEWVYFLVPLLAISFTNNNYFIFIIAILNSFLLLVGYLFSEVVLSGIVIFHRILGIVMIWTFYININSRNNSREQLIKKQQQLTEEEEQLKENQIDLNRAQAVAHIGSWRMDVQKNELLWSDETYHIFGIEEKTPLTYETFLSRVHPDDREYVDQQWKSALTGVPYNLQHRIVVGNEIKWVHEKVELEFDSAGVLTGGFGTAQDITEVKNMEQVIVDEAKYTSESTNPVMRLTYDGFVTYANEPSKSLERLWNGEINAPISEPWRSIAVAAYSSGTHKNVEIESVGHTFSLSIVPITGAGYINVYGRDISEFKSSEEKYRLLFTSTLSGTALNEIITDESGEAVDFLFLEVNPAFEQIIGLKAEDIVGKTVRQVIPGIEKDPAGWIDKYGQVVFEGVKMQFEEFSDIFKKWFKVTAFKTKDKQFSVVFEDITERKKAEQDLLQSEKRLKILNENLENIVVQRTEQVRALSMALTLAEQRERKRFSYTLHENLQQLLLGAKMLLTQHLNDHAIEQEPKEFDDVAESLSILDQAVKTVRTLSIELNPPILRSEGLDVALKWLLEHMMNHYGLQVDLHIRGNTRLIKGETQLMVTQMVRELLNNVVQYAGVLNCTLIAIFEIKQVRIVVSDTGKGFNTTEVLKEKADGVRLGLFSIRERLRLFNGDLIIDSVIGLGTRCEIILPLQKNKKE